MRASNLAMRAALLLAAGAALAAVGSFGTLWATGAFASQETCRKRLRRRAPR